MDYKEELIDKIEEVVGFLPPGTRHLLKVLAHPEVIELTNQYFSIMDKSSMCLKYEYPWSCIRESEIRYENIKYGWLGGSSGAGYSEWWCDNCRKRVMPELVMPDHPDASLEEIVTAMDQLEQINKE